MVHMVTRLIWSHQHANIPDAALNEKPGGNTLVVIADFLAAVVLFHVNVWLYTCVSVF